MVLVQEIETFQWFFQDQLLSETDTLTILAGTGQSGAYRVIVTDNCNAANTYTCFFVLNFFNPLAVTLSYVITADCCGSTNTGPDVPIECGSTIPNLACCEKVTLTAIATGGPDGEYLYVWTDQNGLVVSNEQSFIPEISGTYTVTVSDAFTGFPIEPVSCSVTVNTALVVKLYIEEVNNCITKVKELCNKDNVKLRETQTKLPSGCSNGRYSALYCSIYL